jgi:hypothetical protein
MMKKETLVLFKFKARYMLFNIQIIYFYVAKKITKQINLFLIALLCKPIKYKPYIEIEISDSISVLIFKMIWTLWIDFFNTFTRYIL